MKILTTTFFLVTFMLTGLQPGIAQQINGFFQGKGKVAVATSTTGESYDEFYFGDKKTPISMAGFDKIVTQSIILYAAYGLNDKTNIIVNIPYIITKGRALDENSEVGEKNFQNGSIGFQRKLLENENSTGTFTLAGGVAVNTPLSDYKTDLIYSIGYQSTQLSTSGLVQYELTNGFLSIPRPVIASALIKCRMLSYEGQR